MAAQTQPPPPAAPKYYAASALLASQAARAAAAARPRGIVALIQAIVRYQIIAATFAERAVSTMLTEQRIDIPPEASLNLPAFTTAPLALERMTAAAETEAEFQRLVESITQETARAVQQAAVVVRPEIGWVRHLTLPSCSRCAVLAGRVYRWSDGFLRHPGCDCVMIPAAENDDSMTYDVEELARSGQVTGLSKADMRALDDGADFSRLVNVRSRKAGLTESGRVLTRAGRPTPEAIYAAAGDDRDAAIEMLKQNGYAAGGAPRSASSGGSGGSSGSTPPAPSNPDPEDWVARQDALGIEAHGETLTPHEIQFVERFQALGHQVEWIPRDTVTHRPTNDFVWLNRGRIECELKSTMPKYGSIRSHIAGAVDRAVAQGVRKENFVIDLGAAPLRPKLKGQLSQYNERNPGKKIAALWVLARGELTEIDLQ